MARWRRKHDKPGEFSTVRDVQRASSLNWLVDLCANHPRDQRLHAAGSHWALSDAARSDFTHIETHDPEATVDAPPALARTLHTVIPGCMNDAFIEWMAQQQEIPTFDGNDGHDGPPYYVHVESGKRIYQLYAELDQDAKHDVDGLAQFLFRFHGTNSYFGPWALRTMGSAGGQTIVGALTTGTHGGDFRLPPLADSVAALHLVADGGKHYWIEPSAQPENGLRLTDGEKLEAVYGDVDGFEIKVDDRLFRAVLVSAGRFGVIYSVVLRAVRQFMLHEERTLLDWQDVKGLVANEHSSLYRPDNNRFLQIVVCLTSHHNSTRNLCGVTKRWKTKVVPAIGPAGRAERVGTLLDRQPGAPPWPQFENAGTSQPYHKDGATFIERACADGDFMIALLQQTCNELKKFVEEHAVEIGSALAAVAVVGAAGTLFALLAALAIILTALLAITAALSGGGNRLGEVMDAVRIELLGRPDPLERQAGVLAWQMIARLAFESQQSNATLDAISYAVMDQHDYVDRSCNFNVDSIEVFFRADDPMLLAFVDSLIAFELSQELRGRACIGYASLRFTAKSDALIGPSRWKRTCVVEVSALKDTDGGTQLVDYAIQLSRNKNYGGILHWGQRNESSAEDIEFRFGDNLVFWRSALASITDDGRLDGFSSAFTRQTGLEVIF
jgi:hypothetical protein